MPTFVIENFELSIQLAIFKVYLAALHDNNLVIVDDGVDPMSDCEDCRGREGLSDRRLDQEVSLEINRGRGLVQ